MDDVIWMNRNESIYCVMKNHGINSETKRSVYDGKLSRFPIER